MSKELEALERLKAITKFNGGRDYALGDKKEFKIIEQALQRLEAIDQAKPSEAFECLNKIVESFNETTTGMNGLGEVVVANDLVYSFKKELDTIKQALLKSQEQEKVLEIIKKKRVNVYTEIILSYTYEEYLELDIIKETSDKWKLTQKEFDLLKRYCDEWLFIWIKRYWYY